MADSADLVVLGAGPAGLTAAWRAARAGLRVTVLERADAVGGLAGSFAVAGVRVDHGSHRLHPSTPPRILADLRTLLGDDLQLRPRNGRLRVAGRWVGFPLRAPELVRRLPPAMLARVAAESLAGPLRRPGADTYAGVLRASLGPTLYEEIYAPYARKLWGLDGDRIDAEQARRRVSADTPLKIAARMLRRRRDGTGRSFYYPRRGFGQIVAALAEAAVAAGAELRLGTEVDGLVAGGDGVGVSAGGWQGTAGHVFSTVPLPVLARIATPAPDPGTVAAAGRLRFRAMVLVYLVHEGRRPWTPYDAHYLPGAATPVTRISEPASYRDSASDPGDRTVLCAEIPCQVGDEVWSAGEDALRELVAGALARHGLPPVRGGGPPQVRRLPRVYPVYERGYAAHLRGLDEWAGRLPRVTTFGRLGLFAHDNTHHAMVMAYDAVAALASGPGAGGGGAGGGGGSGGWDADAWAAARERFATHVVED